MKITDVSLWGLTNLEELDLGNNQIADASLSGLTSLRRLVLHVAVTECRRCGEAL